MKIVRIDLWHVAVPLPAPFRPAWIPGLVQTDNQTYGDEVEVVAIGADAPPHGDAPNPLELALSEPKPTADADARPRAYGEEPDIPPGTSSRGVEHNPALSSGMTDATTRDIGPLRVTSRRKLCESPLALVPLQSAQTAQRDNGAIALV